MPARNDRPPPRRLGLRVAVSSFVVVLVTRIALYLFRYKTIRKWIPEARGHQNSRFYARRVALAVRRSARLVPHATCLTQALAAQYLLARSGHRSTIRIGARRDPEGRLEAHAWLLCDDVIVLGGSDQELAGLVPLTDLN